MIEKVIEAIILAVAAFVVLPVCVYVCVKFGTFGYLMARERFRAAKQENQNGEAERSTGTKTSQRAKKG